MPRSELRHETGTQKVVRQNASARVAIDTSDACMRADTNAFVSRHSLAVSADRRTAATVMKTAIIAKAMRSATLSKTSPPRENRTTDANAVMPVNINLPRI